MYLTHWIGTKPVVSGTYPERRTEPLDVMAAPDVEEYLNRTALSDEAYNERRVLFEAIKESVRRGGLPSLNLSSLSEQTLFTLPNELAEQLQVKQITFPPLRKFPPWLGRVCGLKKLTLTPIGTRIFDLRRLPVIESLAKIHIRESRAKIIVSPLQFDLTVESERKKTKLVQQGSDSYYTNILQSNTYEKRPDKVHINLNGDYTGRDGTRIVCRHLAFQILELERGKRSWEREIGPGFHLIRNPAEELPNLMSENIDQKLELLMEEAPFTVVDDANFATFCARIFHEIESANGAPRQFLMNTRKHSMAATFSVKSIANGRREYVLRFFDPNRTATHKRVVAHNLEKLKAGAARWSMAKIIGEENSYFMSLPRCAAFIEVDAAPEIKARVPRSVSMLAADSACMSSDAYGHLYDAVDLAGLQALAAAATHAVMKDRSRLSSLLEGLRAEIPPTVDADGFSRDVYRFISNAVNERELQNMFPAIATILRDLTKRFAPLDSNEKRLMYEIMAALATGVPAMYDEPQVNALNEYCTLLENLAQHGALDPRQILMLLGGDVDEAYEIRLIEDFKTIYYDDLNDPGKRIIERLLCSPVFNDYQFKSDEEDYQRIRAASL